MARFMLVCLDSESQVELNNADMHNIVWGLKHADAASRGPNAYGKLHERLTEAFRDDVK